MTTRRSTPRSKPASRGKGAARASHRPAGPDASRSALQAARRRLDGIDGEILQLLAQRMNVVQDVLHAKRASGDGVHGVYVPERESAQLSRLARLNATLEPALPAEALQAIFREILASSRALQGELIVAFLGPAGTYSERAARLHFGSATRLAPVGSIREVFRAVESDVAHLGVVPVENSTEGMVGSTLDCFVDTPLHIVAERELDIRHALLSRAPSLRRVRRIFSHAQSLAQCREWIASHLPGVETVEVASNARAAQEAASDSQAAAIAGRDSAELYRLRVLADGVQDLPRNVTRFLVISPRAAREPSGTDKTSILFSVKNAAGMLQRSLQPLARHGLDLCKIESRPMRGRAWEYLFFVDFRGHVGEASVRRAVAEMERSCAWLKVLGSYPSSVRAS